MINDKVLCITDLHGFYKYKIYTITNILYYIDKRYIANILYMVYIYYFAK